MKHPNEVQLALFAGGDLPLWDRWRVKRHVSGCDVCEKEMQALREASSEFRAASNELPKDVNWDRLAEEMTGNIRVGLAAGQAIARFDKPSIVARPLRLGWNAATVIACATIVFLAAFWLNLPQPQDGHLLAALKRIPSAMTQHQTASAEDVVLEASPSSIEVTQNGRSMSLVRPHSDGVTVTISMKGSAGLRYVDADTGQVTTTKVYYAEQ